MSPKFSLDDYVDVAERIVLFKEKHPDGSLTSKWQVLTLGERTFVVCEANAYRDPDDKRPGQGIAWEPFPGATPYTRESELMNAQTSAWGRAIVAVGIVANRSIASRQEVQARQGDNGGRTGGNQSVTAPRLKLLKTLVTQNKPPERTMRAMLDQVGAHEVEFAAGWTDKISNQQASQLIDIFKTGSIPDPAAVDVPVDDPPWTPPVDDGEELPFDAREPEPAA